MSFIYAALAMTVSLSAFAEPMPLKYDAACIVQAIAKRKHIELKSDIPLPAVNVESKTPLKQFQDAIEPQWHFRPDVFTNAFTYATNEIYLIDDSKYYRDHGRTIDDSLAHELTHFLQVRYQHADLESGDDSLEGDAVDTQTWFREEFMEKGQSPCAK